MRQQSRGNGTEIKRGQGFYDARGSGSNIQISRLPKRPGDTLLIAAIFQGQEL